MDLPYLRPAQYPETLPHRLAGHILCLHTQSQEVEALRMDVVPGTGLSFGGVGLIGLADDEGVRLNGGRPGAREGPLAFRAALSAYGVSHPSTHPGQFPPVVDAGDIQPGGSLEETHRRVTAATQRLCDRGLLPVGIGGGHDLTFPLVRGVVESMGAPLEGVYFDAHLDVRQQKGSGMPFRRLIEECGVQRLTCAGFDPLANSREHVEWFQAHGGQLHNFAPTPWPAGENQLQFVSLDLDVIDASHAPGVSAINPAGWPAERVAAYAESAGQSRSVCCFDIMELSPPHDQGGRTARLAAHLFLRFLLGVSRRMQEIDL